MAANEEPSTSAELIAPELALVPLPPPPPPPPATRKPRGRPPGSRNKPKPPVYVTRESEAAMRPVVLELAAGSDMAAALTAFARRRDVGVSVLCGRGALAAVTLRIPISAATASTVALQGRFELLSLSGTVLPSTASEGAVPPPFAVSLAGANGLVIAGTLAGEMTAADGVVLVAATFGIAESHRLPAAEAAEEERDGRGGSQQQVGVAASAGDVGLAGYGGAVGMGGGPPGLVGHYQQLLLAHLPASPGQTNLSPASYYLDRS